MQLQYPAFRILEDWTGKLPEIQIIHNCANEFKLRIGDARRLVLKVTKQLQTLVSCYKEDKIVGVCHEAYPLPDQVTFSTKNYRINGKNLRFRYSDTDLEELIHPGFGYLENKISEAAADHCFDLFYSGNQVFLQTDGQTTWACPDSKPEHFIGLVNMQLLNCLHNTTDAHWMGAVHASAVSASNGAVLFTAPSGSGKSTLAAMLMHQGYQVLSDDFSPVSVNHAKVYPFPEGLSVKNRSLQALQSCFPSLAETGDSLPDDVREVFLPITNGELPAPARVKAIVFLQYDTTVDLELKKIPNLNAMDRFLQQLWLPPKPEVAASFMDWYFQIPCFSLKYSDTTKATESLSKLFNP
ncbi:MAG TPA: hypothetical protein DCR40_02290 [Prolixibacteraceae bacterium]|nr:hypothetical protein [Prolixibacteraceae bacterium]